MDIINLLLDHNIQIASEQDRHYRDGWINMTCPFCTGHPGNHLGYDLERDLFHCWRCGGKTTIYAISGLLSISFDESREIVKKYGYYILTEKNKLPKPKKPHTFPSNITQLKWSHKKYLESRGFDPDKLEQEWDLTGTGPVSHLDGILFKYRILIPIYWNNLQVSFTSRDYTNQQRLKYITCPQDREIIHHKTILYGQQYEWGDTGICVEGPTDVWRFGIKSFATLGIKFTDAQLRLIAHTFKRVIVAFDPEPEAQQQAQRMVNELQFRGVDSFKIDLPGDPGEMKQKEANYLIKQLI